MRESLQEYGPIGPEERETNLKLQIFRKGGSATCICSLRYGLGMREKIPLQDKFYNSAGLGDEIFRTVVEKEGYLLEPKRKEVYPPKSQNQFCI